MFLVAILLAIFAGVTLGQVRSELGKREYMSKCAVCHGLTGKGDGSYFELLKTRVPDITTITERNKGVFPAERMFQIIDGREMPKAHGTREMPIWGQEYLVKASEYYGESPYDPEVYVRVRILSLIDYLYTLQSRR
jgi:hypothetical protein